MPKCINADEFLRRIQEHHYILRSFDNSKDFGLFDCGIKQIVDEMPAADVAEVVRCKDCKYYTESIYFSPNKACYRYKDDKGNKIGYIKSGNDYCSAGERRESNG